MTYSRIRQGEKILGYLRHDLKHSFFSRDFFWWSGAVPAFEEEDAFTNCKDASGRRLFEHDIVSVRFKSPLRRNRPFRIALRGDRFYLLDLKSNKRLPLNSTQVDRMEFLSYTFLNKTLVYGGFPQ